jgi:UDP-N-acetylglucosamine:LPS N-acetylglucosamine transferase
MGVAYHDLDMPESNKYIETLFKAVATIRKIQPHIIIAHEEFAAMIAAHLEDIPAIYMADWLPDPNTLAADSLRTASSIVLMEEAGLFRWQESGLVRPICLGPFVRRTEFAVSQRKKIRQELGLPENACVVLVSPGGWASEESEPIWETVADAFRRLAAPERILYWISRKDYDVLSERASAWPEVRLLRFFTPLEKLMAASDVLITKETRITTLEAASLGVPSVSLCYGSNPVEEILLPRIQSNVALRALAVDGEILHDYVLRCIAKKCEKRTFIDECDMASAVAKEVQRLLNTKRP